jgi:uncharacterized protein DUF6399
MTLCQTTDGGSARQDPCRHSRSARADAHADFSDPFREPLSQRQYAQQHGIPRSTLGDWLRQPAPEGVDPEVVSFFRHPAGERFLRRLLLALHLVFRHHQPCGLRPLCLFLQLSQLDAFVASSYGAQYNLDQSLQRLLLAFATEERSLLADQMKQSLLQPDQPRGIIAALDEHFHGPDPCLVAIEPCSDFILLECYARRRDGDTWTAKLLCAVADLPVHILLAVSDEASGLIRCAQQGLQAMHGPDLFHQQRQLAPVLLPLTRCMQQTHKDVEKAQQHVGRIEETHTHSLTEEERGRVIDLAFVEPMLLALDDEKAAQQRHQQAQQQHEQAVAAVQQLGDGYHPFDRHSGRPLTAEQVQAKLHDPVVRLEQMVQQQQLGDKAAEAVIKATAWLVVLVNCVAWFWRVVRARVEQLELSAAAEEQVYQSLLAGLYWQEQAHRARDADERKRLTELGEKLQQEAWQPGGALACLSKEEREKVERVARECVGWFGRSSSCVEGRNGRLGLFHHGQGPLSEQRLQVLTAMHNYVVRRTDGTTAAERFFGVKQRDAFSWVLARLPELPRPAARRSKHPPPQSAAAV